MSTEVKINAPENTEKEKEQKEDAPPADNGQTKEEAPVEGEKVEEKAEDKKVEPSPPKLTVHKANFEKDIAYLYQFPRAPLLPSTSPFCLKVETWLRLTGIKYEVSAICIIYVMQPTVLHTVVQNKELPPSFHRIGIQVLADLITVPMD